MSEARVIEGLETESTGRFPEKSSETAAPFESNTPGSVLRRAREARGQSITDVVQVIRFSPRQIEALERDDYASLPGATVARGFCRWVACWSSPSSSATSSWLARSWSSCHS